MIGVEPLINFGVTIIRRNSSATISAATSGVLTALARTDCHYDFPKLKTVYNVFDHIYKTDLHNPLCPKFANAANGKLS